MRFCSLGSGSSGNSFLVKNEQTLLVLDCGFSLSEIETRMSQKEINPENITALFLTHEHDDHSRGIFSLADKYKKPIYLTHGTLKMCAKKIRKSYQLKFNIILPLETIILDEFKISSIPVPHDAREPVQFKFESQNKSLAIITDLGFGSNELINSIKEINALILESNHDDSLLRKSRYPIALKNRILSDYGHLSNEQSFQILKKINLDKLKWLGAAHLSRENNSPELVLNSWKSAFKKEINIIDRDFGLNWITI